MRNLLFTISYDGTAYHGWQVQENAPTVQQTVQDALEIICGTRDNIVGCSRTDSGVHAEEFCFNMRTECPLECGVFARALSTLSHRYERAAVYAMVNTLCDNNGMKRVCFFFEGEQAEWIAGEIYWAGVFLYNPDL